MPRKSKKAAKPRTNKQGSINVAGSLHQMVKDYCVEHSMTQVEFIEVSLKVLKLIPGDPRLWTDEVPTPITQAIANLQSAEQAFREFMKLGQVTPPQSRIVKSPQFDMTPLTGTTVSSEPSQPNVQQTKPSAPLAINTSDNKPEVNDGQKDQSNQNSLHERNHKRLMDFLHTQNWDKKEYLSEEKNTRNFRIFSDRDDFETLFERIKENTKNCSSFREPLQFIRNVVYYDQTDWSTTKTW